MLLDNEPVHGECSIMINVTESAAESELGWLFENCQKANSMWTALAEMVHQQPTTPAAMDNTAKNSIDNKTAKQKKN